MLQVLQCANSELQAVVGGSCGAYANAFAELSTELQVPSIAYDGPVLDYIHPTEQGYRQLAARILAQLESSHYIAERP